MSFDFLSGINVLGGGVLGYLVPFLFVLTLVVFFHELGHFLVARRCGVRVLVFSIGFGPELFGFNDRHGTRWKMSAIPLGGYVKFFGDENAASVPDPAGACCHERGRAPGQLRASARGASGGDRGRRPAGEFRACDRDFRRPLHDLRQAEHVASGRRGPARQRRGGGRIQARRRRSGDRRPPIESFPDMQQIVSTSAGETLEFEVEPRRAARSTLKATPALQARSRTLRQCAPNRRSRHHPLALAGGCPFPAGRAG